MTLADYSISRLVNFVPERLPYKPRIAKFVLEIARGMGQGSRDYLALNYKLLRMLSVANSSVFMTSALIKTSLVILGLPIFNLGFYYLPAAAAGFKGIYDILFW